MQTRTLADESYHKLRSDIINGEFEAGTRLTIAKLQTRYNSGAGPLREALNRLTGECIVTSNPQVGFSVSELSISDLKDVTALRNQMECDALRESIRAGDEEWEASIVAAFYKLAKAHRARPRASFEDVERYNQRFHDTLVAACPSKWLLRFRRILFDHHKRYRILAFKGVRKSRRNVEHEHRLIMDATLNRDVATACRHTKHHIRQTMELCEALLTKKLGD